MYGKPMFHHFEHYFNDFNDFYNNLTDNDKTFKPSISKFNNLIIE